MANNMDHHIIFYKETDSTNTRISVLAKEGAPEGTVAWADYQTAGKGRRGRSWESPAGNNLYFSILLRPDIKPEKAPMLTLVMAYSVAKAIENAEKMQVQIKWPNDLILSKKKICGILTEMSLVGNQIDYVVIGVGINVNRREFPQELQEKATSLCIEKGEAVDCERLLGQILREFAEQYDQFLEIQDLLFLQEEYEQMLVNKNQEVLVLEPGNEYQGLALGINREGELLVKRENGETEAVFAGEVSVRGIYGYV